MASRNSTERGAVVAQSAYPLFAGSYAVSAVAAVLPLPPFSRDLGPAGLPLVAESGQLYILQSTQNMNVRFVGSGTVNASGTVTFASASGTVVVTINGYAISFTASGTNLTDATTLATLIGADPILNKFFVGTVAAGVCTIICKLTGAGANLHTLAATGTNVTTSGAFASGVGPAAAAAATTAYFVTANQPAYIFRLYQHTQIDVVAAGAGTLQVFLGV